MDIRKIIQSATGEHLIRALNTAIRHRNTRAVAIFSEEVERRLNEGRKTE